MTRSSKAFHLVRAKQARKTLAPIPQMVPGAPWFVYPAGPVKPLWILMVLRWGLHPDRGIVFQPTRMGP